MSEPNTLFTALGVREDDSARHLNFIDAYTAEHSRTIEPGESDGGRYYSLLASCMRVLRVQRALGIVGDGTGCSVVGEDCCELRPNETFAVAFSLDSPGRASLAAPDSVVTSDASLAGSLQAAGWTQVCSPDPTPFGGGTTLACADRSLLWRQPAHPTSSFDPAFAVIRGPFMLFANSTGSSVPDSVPIVRCAAPPSSSGPGNVTRHFLDSSSACAGERGVPEETIGYAAGSRSGGWASALARCYSAAPASQSGGGSGGGSWYHTVHAGPFGVCAAEHELEATLGWVI